ncbi:MAG: LLM class flavin-dependent oxidoreductase [Xanthobacteraceae bacterium]|nr:LLM class flavin-dependent oxidoreductase [Xanthobacteraceae bacterium]
MSQSPSVEFGVFDHLDQGGRQPSELFDQRLRLIEKYDEAGFYGFFQAEHHGTPLSLSPSPNVFLAAAAARTQRLRLCPLVYILPLYRPLRLIEEICTLDHLSKGRLELGIGRGIAPFELMINGVNPLQAREIFLETLEVIELGLTKKTLTYGGKHHRFNDVPLALSPYQNPHPPFWYGVFTDPESAVMPARKGWNICGITESASIALAIERYRSAAGGTIDPRIKLAMNRTVVVADTDAKAEELARAALPAYKDALNHLWSKFGAKAVQLPETFEALKAKEYLITGSPDSVRDELARQLKTAGVNLCIVKFSLGDLSDTATDRSLDLFVREVMPAFLGSRNPTDSRSAAPPFQSPELVTK